MTSVSEMRLSEIIKSAWEVAFPGSAERDAGFRLEIQRHSRRALYIMAGIFAGLVPLVYPVLSVTPIAPIEAPGGVAVFLGVVGVVAALVLFARSRWGLRYSRAVALWSLFLLTLLSYEFDLSMAVNVYQAERFVLTDATGTLLVAVVLIPALPWQMLLFGLSLAACYPVFFSLSHWPATVPDHSWLSMTAVLALDALMCAALSAATYHRLYSVHRSHQQTMTAQRDLLLSEGAASMGRLSAALSHELNSPLGSLKSAVSTMGDLRRRWRQSDSDEHARLERVALQAERAADQAVERMERIIHRMQRFTNLDRAEERDCLPNRLVEDASSLIDPEARDRVELDLQLGETPPTLSRPQAISAVLSSILQDSATSSPPGGVVLVVTRAIDSRVEIAVEDRRAPIPPRELASLFDPRFQVRGRRIATGNWTWFNSRQVLRELGGDLRVSSDDQRTITTITLPVRQAGSPAPLPNPSL